MTHQVPANPDDTGRMGAVDFERIDLEHIDPASLRAPRLPDVLAAPRGVRVSTPEARAEGGGLDTIPSPPPDALGELEDLEPEA